MLVVPLQLQPAQGVSLTHIHLAVTWVFLLSAAMGHSVMWLSLLKRTKEVLVKIKCFLPVSSP